ncbi:lytic polysaccharide monooxygenase [Streptomyces sp. NPDC127084]|uniref:lytic polysaccharide monooxygenase auxiliary activity family 9 protein n=1 Tax=Streptomyces sp. NPDC127084 TaxID=3347133 RepID=UPI00365DF89D
MSVHRGAVALAALIGGASSVLVAVCATPAGAHGAPTDPASRVVACGPRGDHARSAACVAAVRAGGATAFEKWDNLRVADVAGRDRRMIPDRQLCSAGIDLYKGLDAARDDWPATALKAGAPFTLTYASTIPHRGTFRVFLTRESYDPSTPLSWDDLEREPVASATDPELRDGVYRVRGTLPEGREGRHLLYTVWQNSDTPDTYYSCSDVVLSPARPAAAASTPASTPSNAPTAAPARESAAGTSSSPSRVADTGAARSSADSDTARTNAGGTSARGVPVPVVAGVAALAVAAAVAGAAYARRRRRV